MSVLLYLIFFVSGASALIFETLWFRQAGLVFGNSVWASSLVMASFMAGLALGNGLAARHGWRARRPLLTYARLELTIGLAGLALVLLFPVFTPLLAPLFQGLLDQPQLLNASRLVLAFGLMLLPATAMGATLPILVRPLAAREPDFGRALGRLYGWNTLGAMAGAVAGEAVLIGWLGVRGTGMVAAALNGIAALAAAGLARRVAAAEDAIQPQAAPAERLGAPAWRVLAAAFLAGGLLLALEVVWFRFLVLWVFGTALSFALMLAVVLFGIGAGGLLASTWLRWRPDAHRWVPLVALGAGLAAAFGYVQFNSLFEGQVATFFFGDGHTLLLSARLMLPVSILSGVLFTFLGKALKHAARGEARTTGALTLANTTGAMFGALIGGFLLLPRLGMERSFFVLAAGYTLVAWLGLSLPGQAGARSRREHMALALGALVVAGYLALFPFGLMRNHLIPMVARRWAADGAHIAAFREGTTETVILLRKDLWGEPVYYRLLTNGISMSGSSLFTRRYMNLFVYWPVALHPQAKRALLISYGVGSTAKALTDTAGLESIDVVDISRDILDTSRILYRPPETHPLDDPRVTVHVEDGRFFLLTTGRSYDLITGEPPPPKTAGIVNLYSREYFELLHDRLAPGGIATYWLPVNQLEPPEAKAIVAAFCDAFEDCSLWSGFGPEWILAGTRGRREPATVEEFTRQWRDPVVAPMLRSLGLETPEQMGVLFIADADTLREMSREVEPLTDDRPHRLGRRLPDFVDGFYRELGDPAERKLRFTRSTFIRRHWPQALQASTLRAFDAHDAVDRFSWQGYHQPRAGLPAVHLLLTGTELRTPVLWLLRSSPREAQIARTVAAPAGVVDPLRSEIEGAVAMADRDYLRAERHYHDAQRASAWVERLAQVRVLALGLAGERERAAAILRAADDWIEPQEREAWRWLAGVFDLPQPFPEAASTDAGGTR